MTSQIHWYKIVIFGACGVSNSNTRRAWQGLTANEAVIYYETMGWENIKCKVYGVGSHGFIFFISSDIKAYLPVHHPKAVQIKIRELHQTIIQLQDNNKNF